MMVRWITLIYFLLAPLLIHGQNVRINEYSIHSREIPEEFHGFKILFISDLHINRFTPENYMEGVVAMAMEQQSDLIILGGDYVDGNTENVETALDLLDPWEGLPVVFVIGNHDNWRERNAVVNWLKAKGFIHLENDNYQLEKDGQVIDLIGFPDIYNDVIDEELAYWAVDFSNYIIVISHSPEPYIHLSRDHRIELVLSGHTHGGQVTFFGLWAPILPLEDRRYWKGSYFNDNNQLIISNGIGYSDLGLRLFAPPSMELITLNRIP